MNIRFVLGVVLGVSAIPTLAQSTASQAEQPDSRNGFDVSQPPPNPVLPSPQQKYYNHRPRLILDGEIGSEEALGYEPPSTAFGPTLEIPLGDSWEVQTRAIYSPDRKAVTHDGNSLKLEGAAVWFLNSRIGIMGKIDRNSLWTSNFDKQTLAPSPGIILRTETLGRLYFTYLFPTGCAWATPTNPCTIQSNRLQGGEFRQELRATSHIRLGFRGGVYHFCDQANQNEPQAGRHCHFGMTALIDLGFELHLGEASRFKQKSATNYDNF